MKKTAKKTTTPMTRDQAKNLATKLRTNCEKLPKDAGQGLESKTWDLALDVLLEWAREVATTDVKLSRSLLALSGWLGGDKRREKLHDEAQKSPELALKCGKCGADQDAYGSTCHENKNHHDACGYCEEACPDCEDCEGEEGVWVRPGKNERLTTVGKWEPRK